MSYVTLGTATELQIKVPVNGFTGWGDVMRTDTFLKIAEHLHTGSGDGSQLGTGSLLADAVTGAKIRLDNDEYIRARNAADSANIDLIKVDANDDAYIDPTIAKLNMKQDTYLTGRNAADSADINVLKVNSADKIEIGANILSATIETLTSTTGTVTTLTNDVMVNGDSVTLTDNTSVAADATIITLASNEAVEIKYKMVRGSDVAQGKLCLEQSNAGITRREDSSSDDLGVVFSLASDVLEYTTTNTGNNVTMTYSIMKK